MSFLRRRGVIASAGFRPIVATGGNVVEDEEIGGVLYRLHLFTTVGSSQAFEVQDAGAGAGGFVEYLVIGGGGASNGNRSGGGGAGGYRCSVVGEQSGRLTPAEPLLQVSVGTIPVTVGAGGAAGPWNARNNGNDSVFGTITSIGGGVGGTRQADSSLGLPPGDGGSGGGSLDISTGGGYVAGLGTAGQGFDGGLGGGGSSATSGGGGGGAGQAGNNPSFTGGNGIESNITGTPTFRGGGGGGGGTSGTITGGLGGGGNGTGAGAAGSPGVANTGGGAGGGRDVNTGAAGGSGIVIVRYPLVEV